MSDNGPIEKIKELAPQAGLEVKLAIASRNAAVFGRKVVELEAMLRKAMGALGDISDGEPEWPDEAEKELDWCRNRARTTLEILKEQTK